MEPFTTWKCGAGWCRSKFPMAIQSFATLTLRTVEAAEVIKVAIYEATAEVFELDIVPTAKELSPVTAEGLARNLELKAEGKLGGRRPGGTGTNRRSIDSVVEDSAEGPQAELFTQSGYGGYLEVGTSKMRAQPYLWPAFEQHIGKLPAMVKEKIGG
jgi:HK97 gp10 family phage protein